MTNSAEEAVSSSMITSTDEDDLAMTTPVEKGYLNIDNLCWREWFKQWLPLLKRGDLCNF